MDTKKFDTVTKLFARRKLSRRQALRQGGAGLAAGALAVAGLSPAKAEDATPEPAPAGKRGPSMLFLQSFRSGSIAPKVGVEGRYTVTLEAGLGQTIYFSDRPDRIVGATSTDRFLAGLGFPADNPPNAALVVETASGETDIAVVELFNPVLDFESDGVTYDVEVLSAWQSSLKMGFIDGPTDLSDLISSFGAAHLFIDDCQSSNIACFIPAEDDSDSDVIVDWVAVGEDGAMCWSTTYDACVPCSPFLEDSDSLGHYWFNQCNTKIAACNRQCFPAFLCDEDTMCFGF